MSIQTVPLQERFDVPLRAAQAGVRRFTVDEYHVMIRNGILTEDDNIELLDGYLVHKMSRNPLHDAGLQLFQTVVPPCLPAGWCIRMQSAITLPTSEPEPDGAVVRGNPRTYVSNHPIVRDVGMVAEIAESSLDSDRIDKGPIYAAASIPHYWIVNLIDRQIEVYSAPSGPGADPHYSQRTDYRAGELVPLVLDGTEVANIAVDDLLP
jgi:Uma2 family endonuclease